MAAGQEDAFLIVHVADLGTSDPFTWMVSRKPSTRDSIHPSARLTIYVKDADGPRWDEDIEIIERSLMKADMERDPYMDPFRTLSEEELEQIRVFNAKLEQHEASMEENHSLEPIWTLSEEVDEMALLNAFVEQRGASMEKGHCLEPHANLEQQGASMEESQSLEYLEQQGASMEESQSLEYLEQQGASIEESHSLEPPACLEQQGASLEESHSLEYLEQHGTESMDESHFLEPHAYLEQQGASMEESHSLEQLAYLEQHGASMEENDSLKPHTMVSRPPLVEIDVNVAWENRPRKNRRNEKLSTAIQSVVARERRAKIVTQLEVIKHMVPGASHMKDTVCMLEYVIGYVKFVESRLPS
ncbi:unnamed protein product [Calypogeia fissa]